MRSSSALLGIAALATFASMALPQAAHAQNRPPDLNQPAPLKGPLNTLVDIGDALRACWQWPSIEDISSGMELTILLSFKRNGEIFGGRITHESRIVSPEERALYYNALVDALKRCSPLPVSESLGNAIAGRPFTFHFLDTRKQKKA
jgi:hypothetical protein